MKRNTSTPAGSRALLRILVGSTRQAGMLAHPVHEQKGREVTPTPIATVRSTKMVSRRSAGQRPLARIAPRQRAEMTRLAHPPATISTAAGRHRHVRDQIAGEQQNNNRTRHEAYRRSAFAPGARWSRCGQWRRSPAGRRKSRAMLATPMPTSSPERWR